MQTIMRNSTGAAVEDVQQRLVIIGALQPEQATGVLDDASIAALQAFCTHLGLPQIDYVDEKTWSALVDASYCLGDRSLYLKMPYFHGNDVRELQQALGALGFSCGCDGIFGVHTEAALRKFQLNMALDSDGIAGANTYQALRNLHHSWEGKPASTLGQHLGFARVADVLERHALCFFGTEPFTRNVASRISNLALATNPSSHIVSAESLLVAPDNNMILVHVVLPESPLAKPNQANEAGPVLFFDDTQTLARRFENAVRGFRKDQKRRIVMVLPSHVWSGAGEARSAQHYAIELLDAVCSALAQLEE